MATRSISLFFVIALLANACSMGSEKHDAEDDDSVDATFIIPPGAVPEAKEITTKTGKKWIVLQTQLGDTSMVNVTVKTEGFIIDNLSADLGETSPVKETYLADMDKNGFEELYLITRSSGPESFEEVMALYSRSDSSASLISFEGPTPYTLKQGELYEGYQGGDNFTMKDGVLSNEFPVFLPGDPMDKPTGGIKRVIYELQKGNDAMQLKPVRSEKVK